MQMRRNLTTHQATTPTHQSIFHDAAEADANLSNAAT